MILFLFPAVALIGIIIFVIQSIIKYDDKTWGYVLMFFGGLFTLLILLMSWASSQPEPAKQEYIELQAIYNTIENEVVNPEIIILFIPKFIEMNETINHNKEVRNNIWVTTFANKFLITVEPFDISVFVSSPK